jgi:hypothetical protein
MRDMKEKFGAEVESFRYAFVIPKRVPGWDEPLKETEALPVLASPAAMGSAGAASVAAPSDGAPRKYIEVKPRSA